MRDRAERFFRNGRELFGRGEYDLAAFNVEQATQLFLKYVLWQYLGDFEKTHSLFELFASLESTLPERAEAIKEFVEKHKETLSALEITYIESRYLPAQFFKEQVEKMIQFVEAMKLILDL